MSEIISRDDQDGRDMAKEAGRKQGQKEERARETQKGELGGGIKIAIAIIALVLIIALAGVLTLTVSVTNAATGNALPFVTKYAVTFPEGKTITIGNSHINVLSYQNELISEIDGDRQKLVEGENRVISERRAVITTFGIVTLIDTNFQINLKYKGIRDNVAYFDMSILTSRQVPDILLKQLLPAEMKAQPM